MAARCFYILSNGSSKDPYRKYEIFWIFASYFRRDISISKSILCIVDEYTYIWESMTPCIVSLESQQLYALYIN